jgi:hypothetical protein
MLMGMVVLFTVFSIVVLMVVMLVVLMRMRMDKAFMPVGMQVQFPI